MFRSLGVVGVWSALALVVVGPFGGTVACVVEVEDEGGSTWVAAVRAAPRAAGERDCDGELLPACEVGWTGPGCDLSCDPGAPECGFRYYCHGDGRVAGVALSRAHLFALKPGVEAAELRDQLEGWIAAHGPDLGLADGLTPEALQLEPADGWQVEQGLLTLYRFRQSYAASEAHPRVPVMGEGALLSLQADPTGAVALTGTVIDPRVWYAYARWQASASQATESIRHHASVRTGVAEEDIEVEALQLVALPWAEQIAWYGAPTAGLMSMGRVIVDADPKVVGTLDLLMYDDGKAYALEDVTQVTVQTQDVMQDPWLEPVVESIEGSLVNGESLLGSIFDGTGQAQLGTEEVVVVDLHGNDFSSASLYDGISQAWDFERYIEPNGQFTADAAQDQFGAQRLYHLVKSGYAMVDRVARGQWDSALWLENPTLQSDYAPGTYRPRIIVGYNHAPTGSAGQASRTYPPLLTEVISGFSELIQQPAPNLQQEVVATINAPLGLIHADTLFHEVGHNLDLFLAPGHPDNHAPPSCPGCGSCTEDTSDEANPLTETIAQMLGMWQLVRVFPDTPHDTCNLMDHLKGGTTNNQENVHSPGCMSTTDTLGLLIRDDDPACPDPSLCDKPSNGETDVLMGAPHWCDATEGYNTFSILQAWWNSLHGLYCEPPGPMGVTCDPQTVVWPPGCDQPGSGTDCATPDETAGLALLYAIRSNPTSYAQLFDGMATFVSCNYGAQAYDDFNQALCDHQIRACDEPAPVVCQQCGNGIREGSEQCDGDDLSVDELGQVATCTSLGYEGGTLGCQSIIDAQPCSYDVSLCTMPGLDDTAASMGGSTSEGTDGLDTDDGIGPGGIDGGDGCACTSSGGAPNRWGTVLSMSLMCLFMARRRGRASTRRVLRALWVMVLGATACADARTPEVQTDEGSTASTGIDAHTDSGSGTDIVPSGWPWAWYGDYHQELFGSVCLGCEYEGQYIDTEGFRNLRLEPGRATIERFTQEEGSEVYEWTFATELEGEAVRLLPPDGQWGVPYFDAEDVLFRAGLDCDALELEVYGRPPPYEPFYTMTWSRGRICLVDPYISHPSDTWMIDLCPGTESSCDGG